MLGDEPSGSILIKKDKPASLDVPGLPRRTRLAARLERDAY